MEKRYGYITPDDYAKAAENGINARTVYQRVMSQGWDIDRAIEQPLVVRRAVDSNWERWKQVALNNGISKTLFNQRIKTSGWSSEKAATSPIGKGKPLKIEWTDEEREIARKNGLDKNYMNAVKTRIRLGWTRESAINTPLITEKERAIRAAEGTRAYHERRKKNESVNA